jgi:hypothetical protein
MRYKALVKFDFHLALHLWHFDFLWNKVAERFGVLPKTSEWAKKWADGRHCIFLELTGLVGNRFLYNEGAVQQVNQA